MKATVTSILDLIRGARERKTAADLREALALISVERADELVAELAAKRQAALLDATDKEVAALEEQLAAARREADRARAAVAELENRIAQADEVEGEAARVDRYNAAKAKHAALAKRLPAYEKAARQIAALIGEIEEAERERLLINAELPDGAEPLRSPEMIVRDQRLLEREIVSEEIVEKWVNAESGGFLDERQEAAIQGNFLPRPGQTPMRVEKRRFREIAFHPPEIHSWIDPLHKIVKLPGLTSRDHAIWPAPAAGVVEQRERPVQIEYLPADEA